VLYKYIIFPYQEVKVKATIDETKLFAVIPVKSPTEAETVIMAILRQYSKWLESISNGETSSEIQYAKLVDQFSVQKKYAYELPLTELRRTGEMDEWTPHPLRLYVKQNFRSRKLEVIIWDNSGGWKAVDKWVPPEWM